MAAREKQKLIKDRFRSWVFTDPERTERLVRIYNDSFNNMRPRLFDGAHLDFPGMNQTIQLAPHQMDAVWRIMSSGNTLLAHAVGAGKTFVMAAAGMKLRQAGLVKKPMYVVPNHLLEQFAREFMQLYPNAKLLVAAKEDLSRDRRKLLTAKIASGDWDGIVVTHSSLKLASQYPRIKAVTGIPPTRTVRAGDRSSLILSGRAGFRNDEIGMAGARIQDIFTFVICLSRRTSSLSAQTIKCFPEGVRREWIHACLTQ